ADRVDHDARPEASAVLAHAPAFRLVFALAPRSRQRLLRDPALPVLIGIETREVVPDDLLGGVALDALRARVPVGDDAVRNEHEDGVVDHPPDQQAKAPLAFAQRFLRLHSIGHFARDRDEAGDGPTLVAHSLDHTACPKARAVLAHAPALRLEPAIAPRRREHRLRPGARLIFGREEDGEVAPDNVGRRVALEALGADVPAR